MLLAAMRLARTSSTLALAALLVATTTRADDVSEARDQFKKGAELAKDAQWGAALAAYERSSKLRPHPWTTYNIGVCERALGQYVRARKTFEKALEQRTSDADLPSATVDDVKRFLGEIDRLVGSLDVAVEPSDARIAVDGQPFEGEAKAGTAHLVLDPGRHVIVLSREGFSDAVHAEDVRPGDKRAIKLSLDRLPATLAVRASKPDAVVSVDGLDVGVAPVDLLRPAGTHHVIVRRSGFVPYETDAVVRPGQRAELVAALKEEKPSVLSRWWFWTAAGVLVTGAAITTYALTRPDPERPPLDGGGLGWTVRAP
jgi:hypothetical protein